MAVRLGHFVFENAGSGGLLSKYCNPGLDAPLTEAAARIHADPIFPDDHFCGEFLTTWVESITNLVTCDARLIIARKEDEKRSTPENRIFLPDLYTLYWFGVNDQKLLYNGEAMLYKGMLIGAYM